MSQPTFKSTKPSLLGALLFELDKFCSNSVAFRKYFLATFSIPIIISAFLLFKCCSSQLLLLLVIVHWCLSLFQVIRLTYFYTVKSTTFHTSYPQKASRIIPCFTLRIPQTYCCSLLLNIYKEPQPTLQDLQSFIRIFKQNLSENGSLHNYLQQYHNFSYQEILFLLHTYGFHLATGKLSVPLFAHAQIHVTIHFNYGF